MRDSTSTSTQLLSSVMSGAVVQLFCLQFVDLCFELVYMNFECVIHPGVTWLIIVMVADVQI